MSEFSTFFESTGMGRLLADAKTVDLPSGDVLFRYRIGTDHEIYRKGKMCKHLEAHPAQTVVSKGAMYNILLQALVKGARVHIKGTPITDVVDKPDGATERYTTLRVSPENLRLLDPPAKVVKPEEDELMSTSPLDFLPPSDVSELAASSSYHPSAIRPPSPSDQPVKAESHAAREYREHSSGGLVFEPESAGRVRTPASPVRQPASSSSRNLLDFD